MTKRHITRLKKSYEEHEKKEFGTMIIIKVMTFIFNEYNKEIASIKGTMTLEVRIYMLTDSKKRYDNRGYNNGYNNGYKR